MPLRLYLDDCADSSRLYATLTGEPYQHTVVRPREVGLVGRNDAEHFAYARTHDLILVTKNPADFLALHAQHPEHAGIFAIYQDNRPGDMAAVDIANAMQNLANAGLDLANGFHVLNHWQS